MILDNTEKLVDLLQLSFPLTAQPYADIGARLGISQEEVMAAIRRLKDEGFIRQIGPVFNAGCLGYKTTLAAMSVDKSNLERASRVIQEHRGISHGYERDNSFNLWVTLATTGDIDAELAMLADQAGAEQYFSLPAVKLFKLSTLFTRGKQSQWQKTENNLAACQQKATLSSQDRAVINEIQQDLPLVSHPFAPMSARAGLEENEFLSHCASLLRCGIMRRFGAALNHRRAGLVANAMTCWAAPADKLDSLGERLALQPQVSHCYQRKANPLWQYNLFAMIHGRTREECREVAQSISSETGITDCVLLFSTREIKKTRIKYLV
jgi:DNA-binding Lrp family transcriptional regulator